MDESLQQYLALGLVIAIVGAELVRRYRKKRQGKVGCDACDSGTGKSTNADGEAPVNFYKKR